MHKVNLGLPVSGAPETLHRREYDERRKRGRESESASEKGRGGRVAGGRGGMRPGLMDVWYPRFPFRLARVSWPRSINGPVIAYL